MIDPRWMRWLLPGILGTGLALLACAAASIVVAVRHDPGGWLEAVITIPFAFVFLRASRSLLRAAGADAPVERRVEALGDVVRALQLTGGLALLALLTVPFAVLAVGAMLFGY